MKIEIKDNFTNDINIIENIDFKYINDELSYVYNFEKYLWKFKENEILLEKKGEIEYLQKYIKGRLTKSIIKMNDLEMELYILTKEIEKEENNIKLVYNIYNDKDIENLISSFEVKINLGGINGK
ncbi:DUF1934 family protein [Streptobacillus moniliformis]|uniref:Uncharacterized protein n=1 Tax=Streptobacillus moniliformis (strain ATCC 14647 / DSM 12112 / NCTC 10651 / 9901) TaxID=519441 RepID=D1AUU0_STRM9|nr:DUF1934 family protein [Streptobacillus moniliformis]ACZ01500.1 hypothetical protein Smon_1035 [Streptobacillus moniliformis DSM 12112]AVL43499.1 DUF1934 domain-containing protein [Streptobacillus moniliformis]SQA13339.1 Uncharacterised protein [Streptobacillus moniliformis]